MTGGNDHFAIVLIPRASFRLALTERLDCRSCRNRFSARAVWSPGFQFSGALQLITRLSSLPEGHIQHPMHRILYPPMTSRRLKQPPCVRIQAGDVIPGLHRHLPSLAPFRLDHADTPQPGPVPGSVLVLQAGRVVGSSAFPSLDTPVALVQGGGAVVRHSVITRFPKRRRQQPGLLTGHVSKRHLLYSPHSVFLIVYTAAFEHQALWFITVDDRRIRRFGHLEFLAINFVFTSS